MKKVFKIIAIVLVVLLLGFYPSIVIINNCIANKIEKNLVKYDLPENTVLVDSISIAGKLTGNGNGMQYMGSILVKSDLDEQELKEYYSQDFDSIEVHRQTSEKLDFIHSTSHYFRHIEDIETGTYYSVTCWDSNREETFSKNIIFWLDLDLRGH